MPDDVSRRKMKVRDEIESHIALLSSQIERGHVQIEADRAMVETLRWVIGDGQLPGITPPEDA